MTEHTPPANAKKVTVYGFEVALFTVEIFNDNQSIKAVYFENDTWQFLAQPDYYVSDLTTKEKTDEIFNSCLDEINLAIENVLAPKEPGDEPENGQERIEWLLGKLAVQNNQLTKS